MPDPNRDLKRRALEALEKSSLLSGASISISVSGTVLTLSGTVENAAQIDIATSVAKSVTGASEVIQQLNVGAPAAAAVESSIRAALRESLEIPRDRIQAHVSHDAVTLEGVVRWNYQKTAALEIASKNASGFKIIDKLSVDNQLSDDLSAEKILHVLQADARIRLDDLSAIVNGRNIILVGSVPTDEQKKLLQQIVEVIPGVSSVQNAVHVK